MDENIPYVKSRLDGSFSIEYRDICLEMKPSGDKRTYKVIVNKLERNWLSGNVEQRVKIRMNIPSKSRKIDRRPDYIRINPALPGDRKSLRYMLDNYKGSPSLRKMSDEQWARLEHTLAKHSGADMSELEKLADLAGITDKCHSDKYVENRAHDQSYAGFFTRK